MQKFDISKNVAQIKQKLSFCLLLVLTLFQFALSNISQKFSATDFI